MSSLNKEMAKCIGPIGTSSPCGSGSVASGVWAQFRARMFLAWPVVCGMLKSEQAVVAFHSHN